MRGITFMYVQTFLVQTCKKDSHYFMLKSLIPEKISELCMIPVFLIIARTPSEQVNEVVRQ